MDGVDGASLQNTANLAHLPTHTQKGGAGVLELMPAVRHLNRAPLDDGSAGAAAAAARDDLHFGPGRQPSRDSRRLAVRQEVDDLAPLEVADQRAVAVALTPRPSLRCR